MKTDYYLKLHLTDAAGKTIKSTDVSNLQIRLFTDDENKYIKTDKIITKDEEEFAVFEAEDLDTLHSGVIAYFYTYDIADDNFSDRSYNHISNNRYTNDYLRNDVEVGRYSDLTPEEQQSIIDRKIENVLEIVDNKIKAIDLSGYVTTDSLPPIIWREINQAAVLGDNEVTTGKSASPTATSVVIGNTNKVDGKSNLVVGEGNKIDGNDFNLINGKGNSISRNIIESDGYLITARSFISGLNNQIGIGNSIGVIGHSNKVGLQTSSNQTFVSGYNNVVDSALNFVAGSDNVVSGKGSQLIIGTSNRASGMYAYTIGYKTITTGRGAINLLIGGENNGTQSITIGNDCIMNSSASKSYLIGTKLNNIREYEFVVGRNNYPVSAAFTVGVGWDYKTNGMVIEHNGDNMYIKGVGDYDGTEIQDKQSLQAVIRKLEERITALESK